MSDFKNRLNEYVDIFNCFVEEKMSMNNFDGRKSSGFELMNEAMSYSLKNGGKRIRPVLAMEFCRLCGSDVKDVLPFALAVEMVHTYSLIHDDLPCMDDDDMRRGKPSSHVVFGYANALLAGDGLLTLAFEEIAASQLSAEKKIDAVKYLSVAAGSSGMIAGQVMDLANENTVADLETVIATDRLKTGEMIKVSSMMGCIAAGANQEQINAARIYCENIGLAFQIVDDILDVTGSVEELGKPIGSDKENNKSTYVSLLGLNKSREYANELTYKAVDSLNIFGDEAGFLKELAVNLLERTN